MSDSDHETEIAVLRRMGAVRRPWFLPATLLIVIATPVGSSTVLARIFNTRGDIGPLFALAAGALAAVSILGHSPEAHPDVATGQYALFWSPRTARARMTFAVIAFVLLAAGFAIDMLTR